MVEIHAAGRRDGSVVVVVAAAAEVAEVVSVAAVVVAEVVSAARRAGEGRAAAVRGVAGRAIFAAMALRSLTTRMLISCGITWMIARRSSGTARAARARNTSVGFR